MRCWICLTSEWYLNLYSKGIRCNAVLPGFIGTPMTAAVPDKVIKMLLPLIPLGRMGSPEGQSRSHGAFIN